jgi:hypothetical protein
MKILLISTILFLTGCDFGDDKADQQLEERIGAETQQVQVREQEARDQLATKMERDLSERQRLYSGLKGKFTGSFLLDHSLIDITIEILPALVMPPRTGRVRTPEEIQVDLDRQGFVARVSLIENASRSLLASCLSSTVKIDPELGHSSWAVDSSSCQLTFWLVPETEDTFNQILINQQNTVDSFQLVFSPASGLDEFSALMTRK